MADALKFDALMVPDSVSGSGDLHARLARIGDLYERLTGSRPKPVWWARPAQTGWHFVSPNAGDTINFAKSHDKADQPRYFWAEGPEGVKLGTLAEGA